PPKPEEPVQPPKPEEPVQPPKPEEPVQPPKPEEPVQPPKPEEPVQPPEPKQPVEPPKAPGQELLEGVRDTSDAVKNAHDRVEGILDDLPIDDETRDAIREEINPIGEKAEEIKGYAEKGLEYIKVLDENLAETDKMKITPQSQEALGWWRVTFKAIGEVTEKFVDTVTEPFTSLFGEQGGEKVQEIIHEAVPIAEFGEELSKLPTSAARNIIGAQQRDQEGIDDIIDEIYPRDWSRQ
ncbi:MAG: hypothetical protein JW726_08670, partial [Anaerolineales bacterium]|nr:hypothetical protein [Anaerolineales bacterium]